MSACSDKKLDHVSGEPTIRVDEVMEMPLEKAQSITRDLIGQHSGK